MLDIFAWVVLVILLASGLALFFIAGYLPGAIAKSRGDGSAVRVKLDDAKLAASLPAGTAGAAAIYTSHIKPSHIIRKVILRQIAIVNYVNPF